MTRFDTSSRELISDRLTDELEDPSVDGVALRAPSGIARRDSQSCSRFPSGRIALPCQPRQSSVTVSLIEQRNLHMDLYIVQHVDDRALVGDEGDKLIGVYSTEQAARAVIGRLVPQPRLPDVPSGSRVDVDGTEESPS